MAESVHLNLEIVATVGGHEDYPAGLEDSKEQALFDLERDPGLFWESQVLDWWEGS